MKMIDFEKFDIKEDGAKIVITVLLRERTKNERKQICTTKDVINELTNRGINVGDCGTEPFVSNRNRNRISGEWVFNLPRKTKGVISPKEKSKTSSQRGSKK